MDLKFDAERQLWADREERAEKLISLIGTLYRRHGVITSLQGQRLINLSAIGILNAVTYAQHTYGDSADLVALEEILEALVELGPGAASIDLSRLLSRREEAAAARGSAAADGSAIAAAPALAQFLRAELTEVMNTADEVTPTDVVLYGFGRIGRLLARILISHAGHGEGLRLRAVVVRRGSENDLMKRASLLERDSVHGPFQGSITVDEEANTILANGTLIQVIYANDPAAIDYTAYGISEAIVVDNTGRWRDEEGLSQHLRSAGVARVLLTAPGKGALKNVVYGINDAAITPEDRIITAASCTTNAITPVLKVINDRFGINHGHVETVHSFTNDQNLIDNFHSGDRRGRSAALNMVITETGAATAVAKALPELAGKLTGNAIRVPTPDVSLAILNLSLREGTTREEVNSYLRDIARNSTLRQQIDYVESPEIVSSDFVGSHRAGIVDGLATISTENTLILYVWYDNEFGYSCQVVRVLERLAGSHPRVLPHRIPA